MTNQQNNYCNFWDVGWCYAPKYVETNASSGACLDPKSCPQIKTQMTEMNGGNTPIVPQETIDRWERDQFFDMIKRLKDKNWYVDTKILLKSNWSPTTQTPEETEQSLKDAMRKAIDDGIIPSREELEKEAENYMKLKNLLKAIDEYFDENKPPTLKERFEEYLQKGDFAQSHHVIANELVDIVNEFIPPSSTTNSYEWERCLKTIRDKLR
jgi:hypothetical protein